MFHNFRVSPGLPCKWCKAKSWDLELRLILLPSPPPGPPSHLASLGQGKPWVVMFRLEPSEDPVPLLCLCGSLRMFLRSQSTSSWDHEMCLLRLSPSSFLTKLKGLDKRAARFLTLPSALCLFMSFFPKMFLNSLRGCFSCSLALLCCSFSTQISCHSWCIWVALKFLV